MTTEKLLYFGRSDPGWWLGALALAVAAFVVAYRARREARTTSFADGCVRKLSWLCGAYVPSLIGGWALFVFGGVCPTLQMNGPDGGWWSQWVWLWLVSMPLCALGCLFGFVGSLRYVGTPGRRGVAAALTLAAAAATGAVLMPNAPMA